MLLRKGHHFPTARAAALWWRWTAPRHVLGVLPRSCTTRLPSTGQPGFGAAQGTGGDRILPTHTALQDSQHALQWTARELYRPGEVSPWGWAARTLRLAVTQDAWQRPAHLASPPQTAPVSKFNWCMRPCRGRAPRAALHPPPGSAWRHVCGARQGLACARPAWRVGSES